MFIESLQLWLIVFVFDTARYLFGAGSVYIVLSIFMRRFSARYKIQQRQATTADLRREVSYSLLTTAVYASVALLTISMKNDGILQIYSDWHQQGLLYTVISLPLILVLHDTYFYWVHRLMHHRLLFRTFHLLHHRSRTPTPWAAYAFAPGEAFMMALFVPLVLYFLPMHDLVLGAFLTIMIVRNAMGHSGVEFHPDGWIDGPLDLLTTVTHHDLHHQRARGHYGLYFTWWDRWMGTEFDDYHEQFRSARAGNQPEQVQAEQLEAAA